MEQDQRTVNGAQKQIKKNNLLENSRYDAGADPGGTHPARAPPKIGKKYDFWGKIMIFHTKKSKNFRTSLCSAQFFLSVPPLT
jgi:hypothetical protein